MNHIIILLKERLKIIFFTKVFGMFFRKKVKKNEGIHQNFFDISLYFLYQCILSML